MNSKKISILIADTDINFCSQVSNHFSDNKWRSSYINQPDQFQSALDEITPDVIIIDKIFGSTNDSSPIRDTRDSSAFCNVPILMTTDCIENSTKIWALKTGADDILCKPINFKLLEAKIVALMRRAASYGPPQQNVIYENVSLNLRTHQAYVNETPLKLTSTEFRIITELILKKGSIVHREQLAQRSLTLRNHSARTIDVHLTSLRKKLGPSVSNRIKTIRGIGYMLSA